MLSQPYTIAVLTSHLQFYLWNSKQQTFLMDKCDGSNGMFFSTQIADTFKARRNKPFMEL